MLIGLGVICLAAFGAAGWSLGWFGHSDASASPPVTVTQTAAMSPSSSTPTTVLTRRPTTTTTLTPAEQRDQAFQSLETIVAGDAQLRPIRGQWVAQLASKYEGVVDKSQQATPFTLVQILAEINALRSNSDYGSIVRVVHQGDWAKSTAGPTPMWVTFADIDATSKDAVTSWCEQHFSQRGPALLNVCYPRKIDPK